MAYFVYKLDQDRNLEFLDSFEEYGEAKNVCREQRSALKHGEPVTVRMVFAKSKKEAETLLMTPRKPSTPVEEWEE